MMTSTNPVNHMCSLVAAALAAEGAEQRLICREADQTLITVSLRAPTPLSHHQVDPWDAEQGDSFEEMMGVLTATHARLRELPR